MALSQWEWQRVADAVEMVESEVATKVENDKWKVYAAGTIIRIDIKRSN